MWLLGLSHMTSIKCSIPTGFQVLPCSTRTVAGMLDFTGPIPVDSSGFLQEWGGHCKVLNSRVLPMDSKFKLCIIFANSNYMFVQEFETFLLLHNLWLTTSSNSSNLLTTQCNFFSAIWISTFFFDIDVLYSLSEALWCSEFKKIRGLKHHNDFGQGMMAIWQVNVMQMSHF